FTLALRRPNPLNPHVVGGEQRVGRPPRLYGRGILTDGSFPGTMRPAVVRSHAHGFAWAGYTNDSNSAARVACVARGPFDAETYRPINITSRSCGLRPPSPPPPGAASRVITITRSVLSSSVQVLAPALVFTVSSSANSVGLFSLMTL